MIRKIIKTCNCFLDICLTISIKSTNRYILSQKCVFHSGIKPFLCNWIEKENKIEIRVCCFDCVNYMICFMNDGGIENRLLIECSRTDLRDNYAIVFTNNHLTDTDSEDSITEFEEVYGLYYNQLHQSFCFTELKAYKFLYTGLCVNCRKIFKTFILKKLHTIIRQVFCFFFLVKKKKKRLR